MTKKGAATLTSGRPFCVYLRTSDALRRGGAHLGRDAGLVLPEVLVEAAGEVMRLLVVARGVSPGAARRKHLGGHFGAGDGDVDAEDRVGARLHPGERAVEDGADHGARVTNLHPRPLAVGAARPARVDEPAVGLVPLNLLAQQVRVDA